LVAGEEADVADAPLRACLEAHGVGDVLALACDRTRRHPDWSG
jgi:hypothetical protein